MSDEKNVPTTPAARLTTALGFDPTKNTASAEVFKAALSRVTAKRAEAQEAEAVVLIEKAIALQGEMAKQERAFAAQKAKFDKELGKLLRTIEAMSKGAEVVTEESAPQSA